MTEELIQIRVCGIDKDGAGREYSIAVPSGSTAMEAAQEGARKFGLKDPRGTPGGVCPGASRRKAPPRLKQGPRFPFRRTAPHRAPRSGPAA